MKPCTCFCEQIDHLVDFASALPFAVAISVLVRKVESFGIAAASICVREW